MERVKRARTIPDRVSVSKNHCTYPLVFPHTKKLERHRLANGKVVNGIGDYSNGKLNYVLGFGDVEFNGKRLGPLGKVDGEVLFGLLAALQLRNRRLKKADSYEENDIDNYSLRFKSVHDLLVFLKMDTHNSFYRERVIEALHRIQNTTLYFSAKIYDVDEKGFSCHSKVLPLFAESTIGDKVNEKGRATDTRIHIAFSKGWYEMHEAYFVITDLELYKKLSPAELNLRNILEPWRDEVLLKGKELVRDIKELAYKIGYGKADLYDLKRHLTRITGVINKECKTEYEIRFDKKKVVFYNEEALGCKEFFKELDGG